MLFRQEGQGCLSATVRHGRLSYPYCLERVHTVKYLKSFVEHLIVLFVHH